MAKKIKAEEIPFTIVMDVKGVQSELVVLSSAAKALEEDNKRLAKEIKDATKQMEKAEKDMKKLSAAGKENSEEFREASATYESAASDLSDYSKTVRDNKKAIDENNKKAQQLTSTLKLEDMTMNQLKQRATQLAKELNNTSKTANPAAYDALKKELKQVNTRMVELRGTSKKVSESFGKMSSGISGALAVFGGNLMTKATEYIKRFIDYVKEFVLEGVDMASSAEGVSRAFNNLGDPNLIAKLREQTQGLTSDYNLMTSAVKANKYKIPVEEVGNLLEFARRRAVDMGKNVDDFQRRIIEGIGKQSKVVLDDLGLSSAEISKVVAKEGNFAKGVISLVNEELEKQGDIALTSADKDQQASVKVQNAQLKLGKQLVWIRDLWSQVKGYAADAIGNISEKYLPKLMKRVEEIINKFIAWYNNSVQLRRITADLYVLFVTAFANIKKDVKIAMDALSGFADVLSNITNPKKALEAYNKFFIDFAKNSAQFSKEVATAIADARKVANQKIEPIKINAEIVTSGDDGSDEDFDYDQDALKKLKAAQTLMLEQLETKHQERMSEIKKKYAAGGFESEAEFNQKLYTEEQAYYLLREKLLDSFISKVTDKELKSDLLSKLAEIQNKRLDQEIKFRAQLEKIILDADPVAKEEKEYKERLHALGIFTTDREVLKMKMIDAESEEEREKIKKQLDALELLEKQYQANLLKIRNDAVRRSDKQIDDSYKAQRDQLKKQLNILEQETDMMNDLMGESSTIGKLGASLFSVEADGEQRELDKMMEIHRLELQMVQEKIDARRKAGEDYQDLLIQQETIEQQMLSVEQSRLMQMAKMYNDLGQQIGTVFGDILTGQKSLLEGIGGLLTDFVFDTLTAVVNAKVAEMTAVAVAAQAKMAAEAFATPDSVLSFGASGAARIAIIGGLITGALAAGKAALSGLLSGGGNSRSSGSSNTTYKRVVKQQAEGKYDVIGEQDGRTYKNVPYTGPAKTGMVYQPTLVGERGAELVVSAPDMKALQRHINYPVIVQALKDVRMGVVPQRAAGKYDSVMDQPANINNYYPDTTELNNTLNRLDGILRSLEKTGLSVNYRDLETTQEKMDKLNKMSNKV